MSLFSKKKETSLHSFEFKPILGGEPEPEADAAEEISPEEQEKQVFEKAYMAGEKAGFEAGLDRAKETVEHLKALILDLEQARKVHYAKLEEEIVDFAFRIAEKVVYHEIEQSPMVRARILSAGLSKLKDGGEITIRVAPGDLEDIQEVLPELCQQIGMAGKVSLEADPEVTPGGCILSTDQCELDARVEKALESIKEAVRQ